MSVTERRIRILKTFGKRLRAARLQAGFRSAAKFAEHLGIEPPAYRHWERGRTAPDLKMLMRLCGHLGTTPNYFLPEAAGEGPPDQQLPPASMSDEGPSVSMGDNTPRHSVDAVLRDAPDHVYEATIELARRLRYPATVSTVSNEPRRRTFIKEWREYRELTQGQAVQKLEPRYSLTQGSLSRIERGLSPYSQDFLEAAASVYCCDPADLLVRKPTDPDGIWSVWNDIDPSDHGRALEVLKAFCKKI